MIEPILPEEAPQPVHAAPPVQAAQPVPAAQSVPAARPADGEPGTGEPFADLAQRPVSEHVAVFEAEHERLQRELGTIDQL